MTLHEYTPGKEIPITKRVVALGFFDGVHTGHRHLLLLAKTLAKQLGANLAVFTFDNRGSFRKGDGYLYTLEQKLAILESLGVNEVILAKFETVCNIDKDAFIKDCLISDMNAGGVVFGFDFRFGKGAKGDADTLSQALCQMNVPYAIATEQTADGKKISTSEIKNCLKDGNAARARILLGAPYFITSNVKRGDGRGKTLGFPTVNTEFEDGQLVIRHGVYRTAVDVDGTLYSAITNVGTCPTFEERRAHAESYIFDFEGDLYGKKIRVFFLDYLREEKRFDSSEELIMQINVDKNKAIKENGELKWQEIGLN